MGAFFSSLLFGSMKEKEKVCLVVRADGHTGVCCFIFKLNDKWHGEYARYTMEGPVDDNNVGVTENLQDLILLKALKYWQDLLEMEEIEGDIIIPGKEEKDLSEEVKKILNEIRLIRDDNRDRSSGLRVIKNCQFQKDQHQEFELHTEDTDLQIIDTDFYLRALCINANESEAPRVILFMEDMTPVNVIVPIADLA